MASTKFSEYMKGEVPYPLMHVLVREMQEGQRISQCFLVRSKTQRATRKGDPYLELVLADRSGTVPARAWAEVLKRSTDDFDEGDFVYIDGRTETYRNSLQVIVETVRNISAFEAENGKIPGFDRSILVPASEHDSEDMWARLMKLAKTIEPSSLRDLTVALLDEHAESFKEFPAAIQYHHAYLGGLLEHSLDVALGVAHYADDHPELHRGLSVAGAALHDIGKIFELENPIAPHHSFSGQLAGHLLLGRDMIREAARRIEWKDKSLPGLLEHIIVSHHGELEYGSAILPKTAEAIVVYHFDNLSAKLNMIQMHIAKDSQKGDFTDWHKLLERKFYKGKPRGLGADG